MCDRHIVCFFQSEFQAFYIFIYWLKVFSVDVVVVNRKARQKFIWIFIFNFTSNVNNVLAFLFSFSSILFLWINVNRYLFTYCTKTKENHIVLLFFLSTRKIRLKGLCMHSNFNDCNAKVRKINKMKIDILFDIIIIIDNAIYDSTNKNENLLGSAFFFLVCFGFIKGLICND